MKQLLTDITTTKDGASFDITRVIMVLNVVALVPVLFIGIGLYVFSYVYSLWHTDIKLFDINAFFMSVMQFEGGVSTLLIGGGASIMMKKSTEPNGTQDTTTVVDTKAQQSTTVIAERL